MLQMSLCLSVFLSRRRPLFKVARGLLVAFAMYNGHGVLFIGHGRFTQESVLHAATVKSYLRYLLSTKNKQEI